MSCFMARPATSTPILSVKWIKRHAYLYEQTYLGPIRSGRPKYRFRYLGRVDDEMAKVAQAQDLTKMAKAIERKRRHASVADGRGS